MEREILFRGKRVDNGEWIYGVPIQYYDGDWQIISGKIGGSVTRTVVYKTIGQYIGLTDKNGRRIFEGDIVTVSREDEPFEIRWEEDTARFVIVSDTVNCDFDNYWGYNLEVIGNIHDDPEMIGGIDNES